MRKIAMVVICLLSTSFAADVASSQSKGAPHPPAPSNYRAQVVRQMSQAYTVTRIRDAGITTPVFTTKSRWVVCVATFENAALFGTLHRLTTIAFNNGQAEIVSARMVRPVKGKTDIAAKTKLDVDGPCKGLITSPFPEIARAGKPS
jgi:hypothetical protein